MKNNTSYALDYKEVNFSALDKKVWKDPKKELPKPTSAKEVILIKTKHSDSDVEVVSGWWIPDSGYKTGRFYIGKTALNNKSIYLYRDLNFLEV